jgi:uncharacterized protein (TIGR00255 family)
MIRSMTGFARSESRGPGCLLLWELRSVNHRYLEMQLRLPDSLRPLEAQIRQLLGEELGRGRIEASLSLRRVDDEPAPLKLNLPLARQLIEQAGELAKAMPGAAPMNPLEVMKWPGVLEQAELSLAELAPPVLDGFRQAVVEISAVRGREGERLAALLLVRCDDIATLVAAVRARLPEVLAKIRDRLRERVEALGASLDPARLEQELAILAQKMDVSEELDRLDSHLVEFRQALAEGKPVGRRLDFLVQEFNREANTLASKSADPLTTSQAVDLKVLIEQMREQIQNIE